MTINALKELFERDLNRLKVDVESYNNLDVMWITTGDIKNSAGNLCVHLIGNLKHYIGKGLMNNDYERDREFEFACKFIPKKDLLSQIDETIEIVNQAFDQLTTEQLNEDFPIQIWNKNVSTIFFLIHLHSHLNYHLGQINYHRRLLDS
jgi:uncharacterized damage-inducible protein DinB